MHEWLNKKAWECLVNWKTLVECELTFPPSLMQEDVLVPTWRWPWRFGGEGGKCSVCVASSLLVLLSSPPLSLRGQHAWQWPSSHVEGLQRIGMFCLFFTTSSWISIPHNPLHLTLTTSVLVFTWRHLSQTPFFLPEPQPPPLCFLHTFWAPFVN